MKVVTPSSPAKDNSSSPIRVSVITTPPKKPADSSDSSPQSRDPHPSSDGLSNGLSPSSDSKALDSPTKSGTSVPPIKIKSPQTPKVPLSPEVSFNSAEYKYVVEYVQGDESKLMVKPSVLSRPKGTLTPKKLRIFLRNATFRANEKHPFAVKVNGNKEVTIPIGNSKCVNSGKLDPASLNHK